VAVCPLSAALSVRAGCVYWHGNVAVTGLAGLVDAADRVCCCIEQAYFGLGVSCSLGCSRMLLGVQAMGRLERLCGGRSGCMDLGFGLGTYPCAALWHEVGLSSTVTDCVDEWLSATLLTVLASFGVGAYWHTCPACMQSPACQANGAGSVARPLALYAGGADLMVMQAPRAAHASWPSTFVHGYGLQRVTSRVVCLPPLHG